MEGPPPEDAEAGWAVEDDDELWHLLDGAGQQPLLGRLFDSRRAASTAIRELGIQNAHLVRTHRDQRGRTFTVYLCERRGCDLRVVLTQVRRLDIHGYRATVVVALDQLCVTGVANPTQAQVAALPIVRAAVTANPRIGGRPLLEIVQRIQGWQITRSMAYRVRDVIVSEQFGDYIQRYRFLPSLLAVFSRLNNRSVVDLVTTLDETVSRFGRAFIAYPYVQQLSSGLQPILGCDGSFMRHTLYRGTMLALVARDGNGRNLTLAVALCTGEDTGNYGWFFDCCIRAGVTFEWPVFSDRNGGLLAAARERQLELHYCTRHIIGNVNHAYRNAGQAVLSEIYRAQSAQTVEEFESILAVIAVTHPEVANYLRQINPESWALYPWLRTRSLFGCRTTSFVEATNSAMLPDRHLPPFAFFERQMIKMMEVAHLRHADAVEWISRGQTVTPYAQRLLQEQMREQGFCRVIQSSDDAAYVVNLRAIPQVRRRVTLNPTECSCGYYAQFQIPCRHILAFLVHLGRIEDMTDFCATFYHAQTYKDAFTVPAGGIDIPLEEELVEEDLAPPLFRPRRGRRRNNRIPSQGEVRRGTTSRQSIA